MMYVLCKVTETSAVLFVFVFVSIHTNKYKSKNDADEAVSVVSLTFSSEGYINGRNSANLEWLTDKTSSIYLYGANKSFALFDL
jgi:hypothetical protein